MPRVYNLPDFNITAGVFNAPGGVPGAWPYVTQCQLYVNSRMLMNNAIPPALLPVGSLIIRFPIAILQPPFPAPGKLTNCIVELIPFLGTFQAYYVILGWEITHRGFPNEYISCLVRQSTAAGGPFDPTRNNP
jgi:hypothetical protein